MLLSFKMFLYVLLFLLPTLPGTAGVTQKPRLPAEVVIAPARQDVSQAMMHPGDVVELIVTASAHIEITDMRIEARLQDGARLVAGDLLWYGKAMNGEKKQMRFSVRLPEQGTGKVLVTVSGLRSGRKVLTRSAHYILGSDRGLEERRPSFLMKKDAQGREIIEY